MVKIQKRKKDDNMQNEICHEILIKYKSIARDELAQIIDIVRTRSLEPMQGHKRLKIGKSGEERKN